MTQVSFVKLINDLPPETGIGTVSLTVRDLDRALDFYENELGLKTHRRAGTAAYLGVGGPDLLELNAAPDAPIARGTTGLYHYALLVPTRRDLALVLRHFIENGTRMQGFSDHLVSEALYLADPDGNGIEVYRDRPRSQWPFDGERLQMATDPLDVQDLLSELAREDPGWSGLPAGTVMGHIHLHVANIPQAESFYRDVMGFDLMVRYGPSASFLSAGGYHHHLGINTWAGPGAQPPPPNAVGLRWFALEVPSPDALAALRSRLESAGIPLEDGEAGIYARDPSQNRILLRVRADGA